MTTDTSHVLSDSSAHQAHPEAVNVEQWAEIYELLGVMANSDPRSQGQGFREAVAAIAETQQLGYLNEAEAEQLTYQATAIYVESIVADRFVSNHFSSPWKSTARWTSGPVKYLPRVGSLIPHRL